MIPAPEALARLHARAVAGAGRGWSTEEFADLLAMPGVFVLGGALSFALGRAVLDEAELLMIATDPDHRRQGLAGKLLAAFEAEARARGAGQAFLEVAADNAPARGLYAARGYAEIGRRAGYYARPGAAPVDAVLMAKALGGG